MGSLIVEAKERVWTYEDYLKLDDEKRYEVINGRLYEMPSPTVEHQRILGRLYKLLDRALANLGEALLSPIDVVLARNTVIQPDLIVVLKDRQGIVGERIFGPPDLVVEIVSPATVRRDTIVKKEIYERHGVKEYWIVYPGERAIEVWVLDEKGRYTLHSVAEGEGKVKSKVLKGLEVDLKEVFK